MSVDPWDNLGLETGLDTPDALIWSGETTTPSPDNLALLRNAWADLTSEAGNKAAEALGRLTAVSETAFASSPSFLMRWYHFQGLALAMLADTEDDEGMSAGAWVAASHMFKQARDIALLGPLPMAAAAQVSLSRWLAHCEYNRLRYDDALDEFLTARAALERYSPGEEKAVARANMRLCGWIGRSQAIAAKFTEAWDSLAYADELRAKYGGALMTQFERGSDEWMRAYILRAMSQLSGGIPDMLRDALRMYRKVEKRLIEESSRIDSLRRLYIQVAEIHMDLAEHARDAGSETRVKANLHFADIYANQAIDSLKESGDAHGALLAELSLARLDHLSYTPSMWPSRRLSLQADESLLAGHPSHVSPRIYDIEKRAIDLGDKVLLAKAMTLRADVLLSMRDFYASLYLYAVALLMFDQAQARGESARTMYGRERAIVLSH
ncbi:MAG TPA: hypothetical protein VF808_08625 [Ktedonobacterales bacterium]